MKNRKLPCVPKHILRAHKVSEPGDHRFMAAGRVCCRRCGVRKGICRLEVVMTAGMV